VVIVKKGMGSVGGLMMGPTNLILSFGFVATMIMVDLQLAI